MLDSSRSGTIASRTVRLPGTPRSTERIFPASGEFTRKSTTFSAASGFAVADEIDQYIEALYHSCASAAEPVIDGGRITMIPPSTAASCATTWFDHATAIASLPVASSDWSRDGAASSTATQALGPAAGSWLCWGNASSEVAVAASKPGRPALYWPWPFWPTHTVERAWPVPIWLMPQVPPGVF